MTEVLNFLARQTRPDIGSAIEISSQFSTKPTNFVLHAVNHIFEYLKSARNFGMVFPLQMSTKKSKFCSDSNFANKKTDRKSKPGRIGLWNDGLLSWMTKKQVCVSVSFAEAKYVALPECCSYIQGL